MSLFGSKSNSAKATEYTSLQLQTSAEGVCIPICWGLNRVSPNLIWTGNFREVQSSSGKKSSGKGGGKSSSKTTTYYAAITLAICEGPINGIDKVYKDSSETTLAALGLTLYVGDDGNTAGGGGMMTSDQVIEAAMLGLSGMTSASTGYDISYPLTAYVHSDSYDCGSAATLPQHSFEVEGFRFYQSGTLPDVNPSDIIYDLCTSQQYGLGMPATALGDRNQFGAYCQAMGIFLSPVLDTQEQAISILQRWAQITNSWIFWSENMLKFVPLGDTAMTAATNGAIINANVSNPGAGFNEGDTGTISGGNGDATFQVTKINTDSSNGSVGAVLEFGLLTQGTGYTEGWGVATSGGSGSGLTLDIYVAPAASYTPITQPIYDLTWEDFQVSGSDAPVTVTRCDPADAYNWIKVEISDREKEYNAATVEFKDQNSIEQYGLLQSQDVQAKEICSREIAATVAAILGKRSVYVRNTYTFKLSFNFVLLEPGDLVTLTEPGIGLDKFPVRIRTMSEDEAGLLTFEAEECPANIGTPAAYSTQTWQGWSAPPTGVDPGDVNAPAILEPPTSVTAGTAQIWIGLSGGIYWGGAEVFVSLDDVNYVQLGEVSKATPQGVLLTALPTHADPDTVDTLSVDLTASHQLLSSAVTPAYADAGLSVCMVGSEVIGYGAAVPNSTNSWSYDLSYLRRGMYQSAVAAHASGTSFWALMPDRVLKINLPQTYVGKTLYLKFPSFNVYGDALQDISHVTRYTYVPTGVAYTIAPPTSAALAVTTPGTSVSIAMTATWAASAGPNLGSYEVQFSTDGGSTWTGPDVTVGASATSYTLSPATAATNYAARVRAISADGLAGSRWTTTGAVNAGSAPVIPSGGATVLPLVNGDIPVGLMVDEYGALVLVAQ